MSVQEGFYRAGGHLSSLQIVDEAATRIAIRIPRNCASSSDFRRSYLDGLPTIKYGSDFHINNHVRPDPEGARYGACSSLVVFIRNLAKAIKEESLQMTPWPSFHFSDSILQELDEGNPENFAAQVQQSFKWSDAVHNNQRVSSHMYFVGFLGWKESDALRPAVHALFTELFQRNIRESFSSEADRFDFTTDEPFPWPILLHRDGSDNNSYETLIPKPNFSMFVDGFPRLVVEISSDPDNQSDLWLVLLSMAAILRSMHEFKSKASPSPPKPSRETIVVAYIRDSQAVVFILYLVPRLDPDGSAPHEVRYTQDVFDLDIRDETCAFLKLLYLFAQRIKDEGRPLIPWNKALSSVGEWARQKELVTFLKKH